MFNTKQIPVLQLVGPDGTATYPMSHVDAGALIRNAYKDGEDGLITITDAAGTHYHPVRHTYAAHLVTQPDHSNASVELWQDDYGIGDASLYLVDPEIPDMAWRINPHQIKARAFGHTAQNLIEGGALLGAIANPVQRAGLVDADRVAVFRPGVGVVIYTEYRDGSTQPAAVAGPVALRFIGDEITTTPAGN